jgi:arylsulfatase
VNGVPQIPLEGTSLVYTFDNPDAPGRHHVQYFATSGNRAIYKDGWWAGDLVRYTWEPNGIAGGEAVLPVDYNVHPWELYHITDDYSQADNLAAKYPEKLKELQTLFDQEAKRNQVYPLLPAYGSLPEPAKQGKTTFTYREGVDRLTSHVAPVLAGKSYTITADIDVPSGGASGVIVAQGSRYGGTTLFVKDNRVIFEINAFGNRSGQIAASDRLTRGKAHIVVEVTPDEGRDGTNSPSFAIRHARPGSGTLQINGSSEGSGHFENVNANASETLDVGSDLGSAVSTEYQSPNRFTGKIEEVTIQLK